MRVYRVKPKIRRLNDQSIQLAAETRYAWATIYYCVWIENKFTCKTPLILFEIRAINEKNAYYLCSSLNRIYTVYICRAYTACEQVWYYMSDTKNCNLKKICKKVLFYGNVANPSILLSQTPTVSFKLKPQMQRIADIDEICLSETAYQKLERIRSCALTILSNFEFTNYYKPCGNVKTHAANG